MYEMCSVHISSYELSSPFTPTSIDQRVFRRRNPAALKGAKPPADVVLERG